YDPHAPIQFRVNVPLMNMPDFAKAFHCPAGSKMNPKERCAVW
ncbi:18S rRNA pseudouridine methyltransferase, partial [Tyrophagus putrescentiae]